MKHNMKHRFKITKRSDRAFARYNVPSWCVYTCVHCGRRLFLDPLWPWSADANSGRHLKTLIGACKGGP